MHELNLSNVSLVTALGIGLVLGLKHSIETDHLVAVSTLVSREKNVARSMWLGAIWGVGHTLTILVVGIAIIALRIQIPESVGVWFEFAVALMLMFLGARNLIWWKRGEGHVCRHEHEGGVAHAHFHRHGEHRCGQAEYSKEAASHSHRHASGGRQSFVVGIVHGLAGSGALVLLVLAAIPHPLWALCYVLVFGLGMIAGMCAVSALFSLSLNLAQRRFAVMGGALQMLAGAASLSFGLYLAYGIGVENFLN